jgi:urease accessory protein
MMFDSASRSDPFSTTTSNSLMQDLPAQDLPRSVRVDARLKLHVDFHAGATRLTERHEAGAMRFRFPRAHGRAPEAILVNVAGGLAGGDRVTTDIRADEGASLSLSSAAAERIYRSAGASTTLATTLDVGDDATCIWLPQETILHDGARLERRFSIDLAAKATLVFGEMLYFGRRASGEGFSHGALTESWRVRHEGKLLLADETRFSRDFSHNILRPAALGAHVALATLLFAHISAGDMLDAIRAQLPDEAGFECGASDLNGLVLIRFAAQDAARLRHHFVKIARFLTERIGKPLPRAMMN